LTAGIQREFPKKREGRRKKFLKKKKAAERLPHKTTSFEEKMIRANRQKRGKLRKETRRKRTRLSGGEGSWREKATGHRFLDEWSWKRGRTLTKLQNIFRGKNQKDRRS